MDSKKVDNSGYFSALFANSRVNACLQMDIAGIIQCTNPAFKTSFGYEDEDVNGKHFSMLFTDEDRAKGKPGQEINNVLTKRQGDDKNFMVHKNGSVSWVSGESVLVEHENGDRSVLKMIQDIHEEKDYETSLIRANDFNETILNAIDDFVIILDKSMQVVKYNPAFSRLFTNNGVLPITDFVGFIKPYDKQGELHHKILEVINTGKSFNKQVVEIVTPTDKRVYDISCQAILNRELEDLVLLVGHDITIQRRVDTEREDLMGFVAHELRNPLASILMSNDLMGLMIKEGSADDLTIMLEKNKKNIERLNKMISELYDATKVGGGNFQLSKIPFGFDDMIKEAVETYRVLQPGFVFTIDGKAGRQANGDRNRMLQVVSNYLGNAVKYSNAVNTILIKVKSDAVNITVSVKDQGPGIAAGQLPYIFDRFFRAEKTRNLEGIGLGLYLCRRIIDAHGGKVWVESEEGKGSAFYFSLPV
ncbi:MAG: ATP-binding protein [Bacteroidota bacterium]